MSRFTETDATGWGGWIKKYRLWLYCLLVVLVFSSVKLLFDRYGINHVQEFGKTHHLTIDNGNDRVPMNANEFGDSFGYVNALFSGFAFAGVVLALLVQTAEFHLAQKERNENLEAQKEIADQAEITARAQMADSILAIHERRRLEIPGTMPPKRRLQFLLSNAEMALDEFRLLINLRERCGLLDNCNRTMDLIIHQRVFETCGSIHSILADATSTINAMWDSQSKRNAEDLFEKVGIFENDCKRYSYENELLKTCTEDIVECMKSSLEELVRRQKEGDFTVSQDIIGQCERTCMSYLFHAMAETLIDLKVFIVK
tara:strand:+ start:3531 stop:4475 length:945 start_codon:yes stop_codon:yes gene_type:complete